MLLILALLGLATSTWLARPAELHNLLGWTFASAWSSLAWCAVCWLSFRWHPVGDAVGGLFAVGLVEASLFTLSAEPLMLAVKPVWELFALGLALGLPATFRSLRALDA